MAWEKDYRLQLLIVNNIGMDFLEGCLSPAEWFDMAENANRRLSVANHAIEKNRAQPDCAALLVQYDIVPRTALLLHQVADRYYAALKTEGGVQALCATAGCRALLAGDPLLRALRFAGALYGLLHSASLVAGLHGESYGQLPTDIRRLTEQLSALPTLQALAAVVRLVASEALPAVAAAEAAGASAREGTRINQKNDSAAAVGSVAAASSQPSAWRYYLPSSELLRGAAAVLMETVKPPSLTAGAGSGSAAAVQVRRRLKGCKASGLLDALCAAVLAAPLPPPSDVAADAATRGEGPQEMLVARLTVISSLQAVVEHAFSYPSLRTLAVELLAAPGVARLRWAALEDVAALDGHTDQRSAVTTVNGQRSHPSAVSAGCAAAPATAGARWLQQHGRLGGRAAVRRFLHAIVQTFAAPYESCCPAPPSAPGAATAHWRRVLALATPVARVLAAEAQALAAPRAALPYGSEHPDLDELRDALEIVSMWVAGALRGVPADGELLALGLEFYGVAVAASVAPWAHAAAAAREAARLAELLAGCQDLPPAVQAACARRLLPTGLLRSIDVVMRRQLAQGGAGALDDAVALCGGYLIEHLLAPAIEARLGGGVGGAPLPLRRDARHGEGGPEVGESAGGGSGGSGGGGGGGGGGAAVLWHPQDDLGLVITWARLASDECVATAARLAGGRAAVAAPPNGEQRMTYLANQLRLAAHGFRSDRGLAGLAAELQRVCDTTPAGAQQHSVERVRVAVLEAASLCNRTVLQLVAALCGGAAALLARRKFALAGSVDAQLRVLAGVLLPVVHCAPAADLMAAELPYALAALGDLMAAAAAAAAPAPRARARGRSYQAETMRRVACDVAAALALMASDEQLVGAVAGWLAGSCPGVDAGTLEAAVAVWDAEAGRNLGALRAAAASGDRAGMLVQWRTEATLEAARALCAELPASRGGVCGLFDPARAGSSVVGLGGAPVWPPHVLRLCGNPRCCNLSADGGCGEAEAELWLRRCGGCRVLRYCGAQCQAEHWREGHKAECGAVAAGRACRAAACSGCATAAPAT